MNKIYKLIWSKTRNMYIAVCEFARSHAKSAKTRIVNRTIVASILACLLSYGVSAPVYADYNPTPTTTTVSWDTFVDKYEFIWTFVAEHGSYEYWTAIDKETGKALLAMGNVNSPVTLFEGYYYTSTDPTFAGGDFKKADNGDYVNRTVAVKWPPQTRFYASFTFPVSLPSESVPVQAHIPVTVFYPPCRHESVPDTTSARIHTGSSAGSP